MRPTHLRTRAQFQALLGTSTVARTTHFALHHIKVPAADAREAEDARSALFSPTELVWVGAMTPKRWARRAVTRNAIRRQIYAVAEDLACPPGAYLVRLRSAFSPAQFPSATSEALKRAVRAELHVLFRKRAA